MKTRLNPWAAGAFLLCLAIWAAFATTVVKLADIYAVRGPDGFRHALMTRMDQKFARLWSIATGVDHLS